MAKKYLFIGADRAVNAGEADYMKALALTMREEDICADGDIYPCRIQKDATSVVKNSSDIYARNVLPSSNNDYDRLPIFDKDFLDSLEIDALDEVEIVGMGQSTDDALMTASEYFREKYIHAFAYYVTHEVEENKIDALSMIHTRIFTPSEDPKVLDNFDVFALNSVPHSFTQKTCEAEYAKFLQSPNGEMVEQMLKMEKRFAIAIVNAGFTVNGNFETCSAEEAYSNGFALGKVMGRGTDLFVADGGPRNSEDEKRGQFCFDQYDEGYRMRQFRRQYVAASIKERFEPDLPYNFIAASFVLAQQGKCQAYVSNIEGYGTMMGALQLVPENVPLVMQPSQVALKYRAKETEFYNKKGIALLSGDGMDFNIQKPERVKADRGQNPSLMILEVLGFKGGNDRQVKPVPALTL